MKNKIDFKEVLKTWEPPLSKNLLYTNYMTKLLTVTNKDYKNVVVRPAKRDIFRAFKLTPYNELKVVIIGQGPYPDARASGLAFGNEEEFFNDLSPSLELMYRCVERFCRDGLYLDFDPTLVSWAKQGVLLLNSTLTVEQGNIGAHTARWRRFVRGTVEAINRDKTGIIFLFLGANAKSFTPYISTNRNYVLSYVHPAFSAKQGIDWNCPHFNKINEILESQNGKENRIKW